MAIINGERLLQDLHRLRTFGAQDRGVVRPAFSVVDLEARRWLRERMEEADLDAEIDGVGNVYGRSRAPGAALLIGSHSDTQPTGGWLDGAMGVIYALEIARAFREHEETRDLAIDVVSWMDEEGAYFGFLGCKSFTGELGPDLPDLTGIDGRTLREAIAAAGFAGRPRALFDHGRHIGYLEAHIEQGGRLEAEGQRIGVVTTIVGIRDYIILFKGQQNHAGTTPMRLRRDAGAALIALAHAIQTEFAKLAGPETVWTIGRVEFQPGAASIIPGSARMTLQFRDVEERRLDRLEAKLNELATAASGKVEILARPQDDRVVAMPMAEVFQEHLARAAERHAPGRWIRMPSGAGHDAQVLGAHTPSGMLFVPSIGGVSHDFSEDTAENDIVLGCQVLATAAATILRDRRAGRALPA